MVEGKGQTRNWLVIALPPAGKTFVGYTNMKKITSSNSNNFIDNFRYLCLATDVPSDKSRSFSIRNAKGTKIEIAVFNIDGKYYAISNTCKHEGGPLSQGILKGKIVTCPWHGWKYSVINGKAPHKGGDSVDSYEIMVMNEELFVNPIPRSNRVTEPHES
jgi:nitrite reductase/ring-hydroxylating ferredoxin subunit